MTGSDSEDAGMDAQRREAAGRDAELNANDETRLRLAEGEGAASADANPVDRAAGGAARARSSALELPADGPLSDAQRAEARAAVRAYLNANKLTHYEAGRAVTYDERTVGRALSGKHPGGPADKVLRALVRWIGDDEQRRHHAKPIGVIDTAVVECVRALAHYAKMHARTGPAAKAHPLTQDTPRIALGVGPAGCGKSLAARAYVSEDPNAMYVRVDASHVNATGLRRLVEEASGTRARPYAQGHFDSLIKRLDGSGRLLIIDEAHRLGFSGCEFLRDLADLAGIPILLLATRELSEQITKGRVRESAMNYDQFSSRIGYVLDLVRGLDGRGGVRRPVFSLDEVRAIFRRDQVRLAPDATEFLQDVAGTEGTGMLRLATAAFELAARAAAKLDGLVTLSLLRSAVQRLLLPVGNASAAEELFGRFEAARRVRVSAMAAAG